MNKNWRNRPTKIDDIPSDINYIISIDESGSANLKQVYKSMDNVSDNDRHFTVTACVISKNDFLFARDKVMLLKNKYWNNAIFKYKDEEKRVCFHSREIRGRKEAFSEQKIQYNDFVSELGKLINELPITLYAANIDKLKHIKRYQNPYEPYDLCINFIFERIMMNVNHDEKCIIVLESRGKKEDKNLLDRIKSLIDNGNNMNSCNIFKKIAGVYFNPKWSKKDNNKKSYWHLELADICAYPIHKYLVYGNKDKAFETLQFKINGYPNYIGYGIKNFP